MNKHVSSFERFLSEYKWSMHEVIVSLLFSHLGERLMVHGAFLTAEDTTFVGKASKKMMGVQKWKLTDLLNELEPKPLAYELGYNAGIHLSFLLTPTIATFTISTMPLSFHREESITRS